MLQDVLLQNGIFTQYVNMPLDRGWLLAWIFDVPQIPVIRNSKPCFVDFFKVCVRPGAVGRGILTQQLTLSCQVLVHIRVDCDVGIQMKSDVFEGA